MSQQNVKMSKTTEDDPLTPLAVISDPASAQPEPNEPPPVPHPQGSAQPASPPPPLPKTDPRSPNEITPEAIAEFSLETHEEQKSKRHRKEHDSETAVTQAGDQIFDSDQDQPSYEESLVAPNLRNPIPQNFFFF